VHECYRRQTTDGRAIAYSERELLRSAPESYPNSLTQRKITPLRRSRSFKVTEFVTNRKLICDCLLVIKVTSYLAPFPRYSRR